MGVCLATSADDKPTNEKRAIIRIAERLTYSPCTSSLRALGKGYNC